LQGGQRGMMFVNAVLCAAALQGAAGTNEALSMAVSASASLAHMKKYFVRSDEEHTSAMASISHSMDTTKALRVLEQHKLVTPALVQLANRVVTKHSGKHQRSFLGTVKKGPGYGGFQPALDLLNSMVYESMMKYDKEAAKCTDFYSRQCGLLEGITSDISQSNFASAGCREKTSSASAQISLLEADLPELKENLKQKEMQCKHEVHELGARLKIVLGDIAVLTKILDMTECGKSSMVQVKLLNCQSHCSKKKFVAVDHDELQKNLAGLRSSVAIGLMQQSFSDLAGKDLSDDDDDDSEESDADAHTVPATTLNMTKKAAPRTGVQPSPCDDPNQGAPSVDDKRAAKCTVSGSPQCNMITERFLLIQSGIQDERDDLQENIGKMEEQCKEETGNMQSQAQGFSQSLSDEQTKLAASMTCEANAAEEGRLGNKQHADATGELKGMMNTCTANYQAFEAEICGLKKIRGELYKMRGAGKPAVFQDCVLAAWTPDECSVQCGGGVQRLTREVTTQPQGGAKCLPRAQDRSCNDQRCPVDCKLEAWVGWSTCSAECGGGVQQRLRDVVRPMKNNGKPCGETSQTQACNVQSCESNCDLSDWTAWGKCSKACDSGTRKREKFVKKQAVGQGSCPDMWDTERLDYQKCNNHACTLQPNAATLTCKAPIDVVLLLDGSGSLKRDGWKASKRAAKAFVGAFMGKDTQARVSVILFSGPKSFPGVKRCFKPGKVPLDLEKDCSIKIVDHFVEGKDLEALQSKIDDLQWPKGSTLTSLALSAAAAELNSGRKDSKSVVVVITDGRPMSFRKTSFASKQLRKVARLMWVPVTRFAPLQKIKKWATRRWQENVIPVTSFADLQKPHIVSRMISDLCPPEGVPQGGLCSTFTCGATGTEACPACAGST